MPNAKPPPKKNEESKKNKNENKMISQLLIATALGKLADNKNKSSRANPRRTNNNNNSNVNRYTNSSGRIRKIPETTPYYNRSLRRFMYKPSIGFYIILGMDRNGHVVKRRVPGHFYYRYDEKLARIVPFTRRLTRAVKKPTEKISNNRSANNYRRQLLKSILK